MALHRRAVFLDRDGTICVDVPYCSRPEDFRLLTDAAEAVATLASHGLLIVVATNQSGIARGYFNRDALDSIHDRMRQQILAGGGRVDAVYYCPHHPDEGCSCRKPLPGMLLQASSDLDIDLHRSFLIGDKEADVKAGRAAGCKTILVAGPPVGDTVRTVRDDTESIADFQARDLHEAVTWILRMDRNACTSQSAP